MIKKNGINTDNVALNVIKWIGSPTSLAVHTALFLIATVILILKMFSFETVMLVWNTLVSLEAIYLAIFIQMSVNIQANQLHEIAENIDEIQDDVDDLQGDVASLEAAD
jgi:low affinity Fe/Cu permease